MSGAVRFWLWGGDYGGTFTAAIVLGILALFVWAMWTERREISRPRDYQRERDEWNRRYRDALWADAANGYEDAREALVAQFNYQLTNLGVAEFSRARDTAGPVDWQQEGWWTE